MRNFRVRPADNKYMEKEMNSIYDYLDYRKFLKDRIKEMRKDNPNFSYRYFNMKSGLKSSGHLKLILDGERNLGKKSMYSVCKGIGLSDKEAQFFETLVQFNQSKDNEQKDHFYNKLIKNYPAQHAKILESKYYKIFSHWYYVAILELVRLDSFRASARWIGNKLKPNVPAVHIRHALYDLELLGLLKKTEDGKYERTDKMLGTPDEVKSIALINFHEQMTHLALRALKKDTVKEKEYSTLTIALSDVKITKLKRKMQDFKREIHAFLEETDENDKSDVVHINLQLFKLTNGGG